MRDQSATMFQAAVLGLRGRASPNHPQGPSTLSILWLVQLDPQLVGHAPGQWLPWQQTSAGTAQPAMLIPGVNSWAVMKLQ